ncbi:hypothetical protein, partial [Mycobacterium kansasii]|uniref:hypothetical protein n=1 Tax=Mycobacterium kansasii TaxID=1768 RepID=UPI001CA576C2
GLPRSFSQRFALRIVAQAVPDCHAPSRNASRCASSLRRCRIATLLLATLRVAHRRSGGAGLPRSFSQRFALRIVAQAGGTILKHADVGQG